MAELRQLAEQLEIDLPSTLARFGGMEKILEKFLQRFLSDQTFAAIKPALDNGDEELLERSVHTLKGLGANLGLETLSKNCQQFLNDIRAKKSNDYESDYAQVAQEYARIMGCFSKEDEKG